MERLVADQMAVAVVDRFERVEVEEDERERVPVALRPRALELDFPHEGASVQEPGQRVVVGEEAHLLELGGRGDGGGRLVGEHA